MGNVIVDSVDAVPILITPFLHADNPTLIFDHAAVTKPSHKTGRPKSKRLASAGTQVKAVRSLTVDVDFCIVHSLASQLRSA